MRGRGHGSVNSPNAPSTDWGVVRSVIPYMAEYKARMFGVLLCLIAAKLANVGTPIVLKHLVDNFTAPKNLWVMPVMLLGAYAALRVGTTLFAALREFLSDKVTHHIVRTSALDVFNRLHSLSLRFHLNRQTGGLTRDVERGTRGISTLISFMLFSILPTLIEIMLVGIILVTQYDWTFFAITLATLSLYIGYTISVTEWRTNFRKQMNELDSKANSRAIDSLLNYETVKYFGNERYEANRYDESMQRWEKAAQKSQTTLSVLNVGQSLIISLGVTLMMWRAVVGVMDGKMSVGDLVLVNAFMIQLYLPLNFLGVMYREIKQALADMERMFSLAREQSDVPDKPDAQGFADNAVSIEFKQVGFSYETNRQILRDVSFTVPAGRAYAVVGASGSGKSTLARLLFRFYDVQQGSICLNGHDIRDLKQTDVRAAIGIVPQDTVLFNDSIAYNIRYAKPLATDAEVSSAAQAASIESFIESLPEKYATPVGERGLKLSGGEKQRVAIARCVLKDPPILIFDEATSALDSQTEKQIQLQLKQVAQARTSLIIAHRLSTIIDADRILVMDAGSIVEQGSHSDLLALNGLYAKMWAIQQESAV
jgi:ATP-binding cassette, subfamily B, heavy metal transporter